MASLQAAITNGQSRATSLQKMNRLIEYGLGIGQSAGVVNYANLRTKLNTLATALGVTNFADRESGSSIRAKLNAMNTALGLDADLDLYYDAALTRYWDADGPVAPSTKIVDTHPQSILVPDGAGGWVSRGVNVLSDGPSGLQTVPTRTNSIRNNSMTGAVAGSPGTLPTNWSVSANGLTRQSVALGTEMGLPYVELVYSGTATATSPFIVYFDTTTAIAASLGQVWTNSFGLKLVTAIGSTPGAVALTNHRVRIIEYAAGVSGNITDTTINPDANFNTYVGTRTLTGASTDAVRPGFLAAMTAGAVYDFTIRIYAPQVELGAFATPPILTSTVAVTRTGNQQVISGLGASLTTGVAFFLKLTPLGIASSGTRHLFGLNDGGGANVITVQINSSSRYLVRGVDTGINAQVGVPVVFVVAAQSGFGVTRVVGGAQIATSTTYPVMNQIRFGNRSSGDGTTQTDYIMTQKLGLKYGAQNQASFDAMYALAAAA